MRDISHFPMPKKFSDLFSMSLKDLQAKWKTVAILAVIFAVLITLAQMMALSTAEKYTTSIFGGISEERMENIAERMEGGDEQALADFMAELGITGDLDSPESEAAVEAMVKQSFKAMLPSFGLYAILSLIITVIAHASYLTFAIQKLKDPWVILQKGLKNSPSLFGVWVWAFLRSFAWIPIIGIIPAIIFGPRMALAPVLLLEKNKGVTDSVSVSMNATQGYWGKIFGNAFLLGVAMFLTAIVASIIIGIVLMAVAPLKVLAGHFVGQVIAAFCAIFFVHLSHTILENPIKGARK